VPRSREIARRPRMVFGSLTGTFEPIWMIVWTTRNLAASKAHRQPRRPGGDRASPRRHRRRHGLCPGRDARALGRSSPGVERADGIPAPRSDCLLGLRRSHHRRPPGPGRGDPGPNGPTPRGRGPAATGRRRDPASSRSHPRPGTAADEATPAQPLRAGPLGLALPVDRGGRVPTPTRGAWRPGRVRAHPVGARPSGSSSGSRPGRARPSCRRSGPTSCWPP